MARIAQITRNTKETDILITLSLDSGPVEISTGIGFFDHMLELFAHHGSFGLKASVKGDTHIDGHHTVEDTGIALGEAFYQAAGDKVGINRYGNISLPMDEVLADVAVDFGGRTFLHFDAVFSHSGADFDMSLVEEFFRAFAMSAKMNLHINVRYGKNDHHIAEAVFKGVARALKQALMITGNTLPSTKGLMA